MSSTLSVRKIFCHRANEFWKRNYFLLWSAWCKLLSTSGERWEVISISWQVETIERRGRGERRELVMIFPIINTPGLPRPTNTVTLDLNSKKGRADQWPLGSLSGNKVFINHISLSFKWGCQKKVENLDFHGEGYRP